MSDVIGRSLTGISSSKITFSTQRPA